MKDTESTDPLTCPSNATDEADPEEPIAVYRQRYEILSKRTFYLYGAKLIVKGWRTFSLPYELSLPLADLQPDRSTLRIRRGLFCVARVLVVLFTIMLCFDQNNFREGSVFKWVLLVFCVGSWLVLILTFRSIEVAIFRWRSGVPAVDVGRLGPDREHFDTFVNQLAEQVELAQERSCGDERDFQNQPFSGEYEDKT